MPSTCRLCWLAENDGRYQRKWDLPVTAPEKPTRRKMQPLPDCPELGEALSAPRLLALGIDAEECGCGGKVRECGLHDVCTTATPREGMACCATCPDHPSRLTA